MVVGGIIVGTAVTIGLILFVVPGIFLAISFLFFIFAVGVEDRGVIGGLKRSWRLARGNRLKLAAIVILAGVIGALVGVIGTLFEVAGAPAVGELAASTIGTVLFIYLYGIMAAAYLQVLEANEVPNSGV